MEQPSARGPARRTASDAVDDALLREMNTVGGGLFLAGGLVVASVLLVGKWSGDDRLLWVSMSVAVIAGAALLANAGRRPLPVPVLGVLAMLGTGNISIAVLGGGAEGAASFGVLYVFVTVFSFYYFPAPLALAEVVATAVAYGVTLAFTPVVDAVAVWLVVTGSNVIIGALIGRGGHRVRRLLESERDAAARLRELDELRTAFLAAVSHELRTPLTSVIGYAEILRRRGPSLQPEQSQEMIERLSRNAARLDRLLTNLLDIDRISRGMVTAQREQVHVGRVVMGAIDQMTVSDHDVRVDIRGLPVARIEASKVERIVENLVGNAVRHTPKGTEVRVIVDQDEHGVVIVVEDDGPGIPDELRTRILDPFVQGHDAAGSPSPGTGIGLSLVAKFAELHDGRVVVESSATGGARFVVHLPDPPEEPTGRPEDLPPMGGPVAVSASD